MKLISISIATVLFGLFAYYTLTNLAVDSNVLIMTAFSSVLFYGIALVLEKSLTKLDVVKK